MDVISQLVLKQTVTIELSLAGSAIAAGNTYKFESDFMDKVRNKVVLGVEFVTASQLAISPTKNRPVVVQADAQNFVLSLVEKKSNLKFVDTTPATRFIPSLYNGYTQVFKPRMIAWTSSEVKIVAAGTIANTQSVVLLVYFRDATPEEAKIYA